MKTENRSIILKAIIILLAALVLFSLSTQTRQALAADSTNPGISASANPEKSSQAAGSYRDIQLAGHIVALILGAGFFLLAVAPFIFLSDQDQQATSDICHFSEKRL